MRQVRQKRENPGQFVGCYMYLSFVLLPICEIIFFFSWLLAKLFKYF